MPSLILNLLIFWFIWSLVTGRRSQRRRQETAGETVAKRKRRPSKRVRRGLGGPSYQEIQEEPESVSEKEPAMATEPRPSESAERKLTQPETNVVVAASQEPAKDVSATDVTGKQPSEEMPALSTDTFLTPGILVQSLILMQALSEPRCKRAWRVR